MGQRVDADAEFANSIGLFVELAIDAAGPQHQGGGKSAYPAADDDRFHGLTLRDQRQRGQGRTAAYSAASGFVASPLSSARVFGLALILRSSRSCRSRT